MGAATTFSLSTRINSVTGKPVHISEQSDSHRYPRSCGKLRSALVSAAHSQKLGCGKLRQENSRKKCLAQSAQKEAGRGELWGSSGFTWTGGKEEGRHSSARGMGITVVGQAEPGPAKKVGFEPSLHGYSEHIRQVSYKPCGQVAAVGTAGDQRRRSLCTTLVLGCCELWNKYHPEKSQKLPKHRPCETFHFYRSICRQHSGLQDGAPPSCSGKPGQWSPEYNPQCPCQQGGQDGATKSEPEAGP